MSERDPSFSTHPELTVEQQLKVTQFIVQHINISPDHAASYHEDTLARWDWNNPDKKSPLWLRRDPYSQEAPTIVDITVVIGKDPEHIGWLEFSKSTTEGKVSAYYIYKRDEPLLIAQHINDLEGTLNAVNHFEGVARKLATIN